MTDRPNVSMIGASIVIKGELSADEDVVNVSPMILYGLTLC